MLLTDLAGAHARAVSSSATGYAFTHLLFSPDGKRIAYVDGHGVGGTVSILEVASGARKPLRSQGTPYGWSPDGSSLLLAGGETPQGPSPSGLRWVRVADEKWTAVPGTSSVPNDDGTSSTSATVSRTGEIVWTAPSAPGGPVLFRLPAGGGRVSTLWAPAGCTLGEPRFAPSGTELAVGLGGSACAAGPSGTVALQVPASGPASQWRPLIRFAPRATTWFTTRSAAPTATLAAPAVTGSSASIRVGVKDSDDAVAGLSLACRLDAGPWQPCTGTWRPTALTSGRHSGSAVATDPSGVRSHVASASWTVDRTPPSVTVAAVPSVVAGTGSQASWSAKDLGGSAVASSDVRERHAALSGAFSGYAFPTSWQGRTSASLPVKLSAGYAYCFSVRARDLVGNVGAWSGERCTSTVLDDRSLTAARGWTRATSASYVSGTYSRAVSTGAQLQRTGVQGRRIAVVATTCLTCGSLDVYHAGVKLGRLNLSSATTRTRQVMWLPPQPVTRTGTVVLRTTSAKQVMVDGLAVAH